MRFAHWIHKGFCRNYGIWSKQCCSSRRRAAARRGAFRPCLEALEDRCLPSTFTVVNTDDGGPGSLRQAILDANATANVDTSGDGVADPDQIVFAIPGAGVHTIQPTTSMPSITEAVIIDGYSQPGASKNTNGPGQADNAVLQIELNAAANGNMNGLVIGDGAAGSTIGGLVIDNGFSLGIEVQGKNVTVEGCFIGVDPAGATARPNGTGINFDLGLDTSNGHVGGTTPAARNLISGNNKGIRIDGGSNHVVEGNLIGTDATGLVGIPNLDGVDLDSANALVGGSTPAARNVINAAFVAFNVNGAAATGNQIQGNFIQVLIDGVTPGASANQAIFLENSSSNTQVGGLTNTPGTGPGNVIAGSTGIQMSGSNNVIQGNLFGTDATGTKAVGIAVDGIAEFGGGFNTIGGPTTDARNVFAACGRYGIQIAQGLTAFPAHDNLVQNNFIGTDITGTPNSMGNDDGVFVQSAKDNKILDNIIAGNRSRGVVIDSDVTNTALLGNSIFGNGGLGIDLNGDGVTKNDLVPGDPDTGGNNLQNFPVITSVNSAGGTTTISGTFNSIPNTTFQLEFFASATAHQGQTFLGLMDVTTDANGDANFTTPPFPSAAGQFITATATRLDDGRPVETSEFSEPLPVEVIEPAASLQFSAPAYVVGEEGVQMLITVTRTGGVHHAVTVDFAASPGTASAGQDFLATAGTLAFAADETSKTFAISILEDTAVEGDETVNLTLSNAQNNAVLGTPSTAVLTIRDNDVPAPPPPAPAPRTQSITFVFVSRQADFRSELGLFQIDDASGRIGNLHPGDPGYTAAALARRQVIFTRNQHPGAVRTLTIPAGSLVAFYLVPNASSNDVLSGILRRAGQHKRHVFFSITAANPDHVNHVRWLSPNRFGFEDLIGGGDRDFNDLVVQFRPGAPKPLQHPNP